MKSYKAVPFSNVDINMGFWQKRQTLNRDVTARAVMDRFMETGRFEAFKCDWREGMEGKPHTRKTGGIENRTQAPARRTYGSLYIFGRCGVWIPA